MKVVSGLQLFQCPRSEPVPAPQWNLPEERRKCDVAAQHPSSQSDIPQGT